MGMCHHNGSDIQNTRPIWRVLLIVAGLVLAIVLLFG